MPAPLLPLAAIGGLALWFALKGSSKDAPNAQDLFDANMPQELRNSVAIAVQQEQDPAKLRAFAATLLPEYPKGAAMLQNAARMREQQAAARQATTPGLPFPAPGALQQIPAGVVPGVPLGQQSFPTPGINPASPLPNFTVPTGPLDNFKPNIPAPAAPAASAPGGGVLATVTTQDSGAAGALRIHPTPDASSPTIGTIPHGATVTLRATVPVNGFLPVTYQGTNGWSSADFLTPQGGATIQPTSVLAPSAGTPMIVTTQTDPLNLRSTPDSSSSGNVIGALAKGSPVLVTGPAALGFFPVFAPLLGKSGFASAQFLTPATSALPSPTSAAVPSLLNVSVPVPSLPGPAFTVTTQTDPLNLRSSPSSASSANVIGALPKGSTVFVQGPPQNGFLPVVTPEPTQSGWASAQFLTPAIGIQTAGVRRFTAGALPPNAAASPAEVKDAAQALTSTLSRGECRAAQEPTVRRFQQIARHAGLYSGPLHGFYDEPTRRALAGALGSAAARPACMTSGGPRNPDTYWVPVPGSA